MAASDGTGQVQRLPILLSRVEGTKLLGVPVIPHKSYTSRGKLISEKSTEII